MLQMSGKHPDTLKSHAMLSKLLMNPGLLQDMLSPPTCRPGMQKTLGMPQDTPKGHSMHHNMQTQADMLPDTLTRQSMLHDMQTRQSMPHNMQTKIGKLSDTMTTV